MTATTTTRHDVPHPPAVAAESWSRTLRLARELAADVDPRRLHSTERLAVLTLAPHLPESAALARFVAWAEAEAELAAIEPDDYSPESAVRRGELGADCARLAGELLGGRTDAPAVLGGLGYASPAETAVYLGDLLNRLRAELAEHRDRLAAARRRVADLEVANLSLSELLDVFRAPAPVALTAAGVAATGGARVLELPLGAGQ